MYIIFLKYVLLLLYYCDMLTKSNQIKTKTNIIIYVNNAMYLLMVLQ